MKIKIDVNEKYTIKLEEVEDFQDSFFSGVYRSALDNLIEIVESSKKAVENSKKSDENSFLRLVSEEKNKDNNIIAFVGERGSGKSSTMISFIKALKTPEKLTKIYSVDSSISNCNFEFLDVIDPSLFEKNDNILEIVIARMFHRFKESFSDNNSNDKNQYANKKALLEKFENVYKSIKVIQKNKKYNSEDELIEEISNLSAGTNLRKSLQSLVKEYLNFFSKNDNSFLVLIIDDFDLNIKHAAEMAEWIRKYLFSPNVIIFTALNFNDLLLLIEQDYSAHLELSLKNNQTNSDEIKDKAYRYLEKFLPYNRRLFLPILNERNKVDNLYFFDEEDRKFLEYNLINLFKNKINKNSRSIDISIEEFVRNEILLNYKNIDEFIKLRENINNKLNSYIVEYKTIKDSINYEINIELNKIFDLSIETKLLRYIENKTGILIFTDFGKKESIIPDSIRELKNMLFFLYSLKYTENNKNIIKRNILSFQNYFINSWIIKNLNEQNKIMFNSIVASNIKNINILIKEKIYSKVLNNSDVGSINLNNSLISLLYLFKEVSKDENMTPLLFSLKTYFSLTNTLLLHENKYSEISYLLNTFAPNINSENLLKKTSLDSVKFFIDIKAIYKRIQTVKSHFVEHFNRLYKKQIKYKEERIKIIIEEIKEVNVTQDTLFTYYINKLKKYSKLINDNEYDQMILKLITNKESSKEDIYKSFLEINTISENFDVFKSYSFFNNPTYGLAISSIIKNAFFTFQFIENIYNVEKAILNNYDELLANLSNHLNSLEECLNESNKINEIRDKINEEKLDFELDTKINENKDIIKNNFTKNLTEGTLIECIEWVYLFFRYFSRENDVYHLNKKHNFFSEFYRYLDINSDSFFSYQFKTKKYNFLSDLVGLEFFIYGCSDLKFKSNIKKIEDWNLNSNSMNKKIEDWQKLNISTFPIYNIDLLYRILPDNLTIENYIYKDYLNKENLIISFISMFHRQSTLLGLEYIEKSFYSNPIFSPFFGSRNKDEFFKIIFKFVFSKDVLDIEIIEKE